MKEQGVSGQSKVSKQVAYEEVCMTTLKYLFSNYIMYNDVKQQTGCWPDWWLFCWEYLWRGESGVVGVVLCQTQRVSLLFFLFAMITTEGSCWNNSAGLLHCTLTAACTQMSIMLWRHGKHRHHTFCACLKIERKEELAASWRYWDKYLIFLGQTSWLVRNWRQDVVDSWWLEPW